MKQFPKGRVVFLTDLSHPQIRKDDEIWAENLRAHGYQVDGEPWETFRDFDDVDAILFRSTWNYFENYKKFNEFLDLAERVGANCYNSVQMVRKNIDKRYLKKLAAQGIPIIPTEWVEQGESYVSAFKGAIIIKPTVSASSSLTFRISSADLEAVNQAIESASCRSGTVMIQPYLTEIEQGGEWSLVYAGGRFLHAIRKFPKTGDFRVQAEHGGTSVRMDPPDTALNIAADTLELIKNEEGEYPLYARVDGVMTENKGFQIMEVELAEPSLYLVHSAASSEDLTAVLLKKITSYKP